MKIPNNPLDLPVLFKGLRVEELEVLDLGSGKLDSPLSIHMRELPFKRLTLVEAWIRSNRILMQLRDKHQLAAQETTILFQNAWDVLMNETRMVITSMTGGRFDVVTMLDIVEHLPIEKAYSLLANAKLVARKRVLVWIPIGECPQEDLEGNPYQVHQSVWTQEMLESLGYQVLVYEKYHKHFDPPVSAAWAVWDRQEELYKITGEEQRKFHGVDITVNFTDEMFADTILNNENIRATEEELEEIKKQYGPVNGEQYEDPDREA